MVKDGRVIALAVGFGAPLAALIYGVVKRPPPPPPPPPLISIEFQVRPVASSPQTVVREATGESGPGFGVYPYITVTGDVDGAYSISWTQDNFFPDHTPGFPKSYSKTVRLVAKVPTEIPLEDFESRFPALGYPITLMDDHFVEYGAKDGVWYRFRIEISGTVTSPSGAKGDFSGAFEERFMRLPPLSVSVSRFGVAVMPTLYARRASEIYLST